MLDIPIALSVIYFVCFAFFLLCGLIVLSIDREALKNRLFFCICMALGFWTFGVSSSISAPDAEMAVLWQRVGAVGWGTMYSFLLHFALVLTERKDLLKKKWIFFVIYAPAVVNIFIFSIYGPIAVGNLIMVNTPMGWAVTRTENWSDRFFDAYYISFTIASLSLLIDWGKRTTKEYLKVIKTLIISIVATLVVGTIVDNVISLHQLKAYPQIAPMLILVPFTVLLYSMQRYEIIKPIFSTLSQVEGGILSQERRSKLFKFLSIAYALGAVMFMITSHLVLHDPVGIVGVYAGILMLFAIIFQFIDKLPIKDEYQDYVVAILISLSIPLIYTRFIEFACLTVWAVPTIFLLITVLFENGRLIMTIGAATLITQVWVWITVPSTLVLLDSNDHLNRILIFAIIIAGCLYVNRVYVSRLRENQNQTRAQQMISTVSAELVNLDESNAEETIGNLLRLSSEYFGVDRTKLLMISRDARAITYGKEWCADGIEPTIGKEGEIVLDDFQKGIEQVFRGEEYCVSNVDLIRPEAWKARDTLKSRGIKSVLSVPMKTHGKVQGIMMFQSLSNFKEWQANEKEFARLLANIAADALGKLDAEKEMRQMAFYDSLTGLANRKMFVTQLKREISLAERTEKLIGVMFVDLDFFKTINDTMGHEAGDDLLIQTAGRLTKCVRRYDLVARFGGDEFMVMITNAGRSEDIAMIADKIMKSFEIPSVLKGQEVHVTGSAGISIFPDDGEDAEELIKNADMAMYTAKARGKNQYTRCSPIMRDDAQKKLKLTNRLYRALERNELRLYYQPQVDLASKKIVGLEALMRWQNPEMGIVMPGTFIPLAEKTGLINPMGEWVLKTACRQSVAWQRKGIPPLRMAINISVEQFRNPNLVAIIQEALSESGLDPQQLELEITESIAVKEPDYIISVLNRIKELGVTLAIDDFGTEYSSLARLKKLPIDRIKIDMQFIQGIAVNQEDEAIAKAIINLARNLRHKVTAEGVEKEPQLDFLTYHVCDEVQGFYYYQPMPAEDIEKILLEQYGS